MVATPCVLAYLHALRTNSWPHERYVSSHCRLGRCRRYQGIMPGLLDKHDLPKCLGILAADSTMQANDGTKIIPRYGCPNYYWSTSSLHCGKKTVGVVSFPGLLLHINLLSSLKNRKIGLIGEYASIGLQTSHCDLYTTSTSSKCW